MKTVSKYLLIIRAFTVLILGGVLVILSSCDGNEETPVDPLVGQYKFVSAILTSDPVPDVPGLDAGSNVSDIIGSALFGVVTCTNSANTAIELKQSKELYFVCIGESKEEKGGTWSVNSMQTEFTLNFSSPPFPQPFSLLLTNVNFDGSVLTGYAANVILPSSLVPNAPPGAPIVTFSVNFTFAQQ